MLRQRFIAEFIGTFALVFAGTGAIVANANGGAAGLIGIALAFGLVILAMIYAIGDISGAHMNPAVTLAFFVGKRLESRWVAPYIVAQCLGAVAASFLLHLLHPAAKDLGATLPSGPLFQSFAYEIILTFFLMFVILGVSTGAKEKGVLAGIAIGATIIFDILLGGTISGASMNPARTLGPALVGANFTALWIYLTAPFIGAILAVFAFGAIHEKK